MSDGLKVALVVEATVILGIFIIAFRIIERTF